MLAEVPLRLASIVADPFLLPKKSSFWKLLICSLGCQHLDEASPAFLFSYLKKSLQGYSFIVVVVVIINNVFFKKKSKEKRRIY